MAIKFESAQMVGESSRTAGGKGKSKPSEQMSKTTTTRSQKAGLQVVYSDDDGYTC